MDFLPSARTLHAISHNRAFAWRAHDCGGMEAGAPRERPSAHERWARYKRAEKSVGGHGGSFSRGHVCGARSSIVDKAG